MGDLGPVLRGLHQYYLQISKEAYSPPKILLRVISPSGQGEQLERFFNQDSESAIREDLSNQDTIDTMLRRVSYVQLDEDTDVGERDAHLTFFRRILIQIACHGHPTRWGVASVSEDLLHRKPST
jgi:hypothetical protein